MNAPEDYEVIQTKDVVQACYLTNANSVLWRSESAQNTSLPFLITQLFIVIFVDRILLLILRPLRQPRIVAHIICGLIFGPTLIGETLFSKKYLFPYKTIMVMETFSNWALVYYMFLVGLEMDFSRIMNSGTQAIVVATAGFLCPLLVGFGLYFVAIDNAVEFDSRGSMFWAVALTSTNFPDLVRILVDLKLLRSNIGKIAAGASILSDLGSWFLLIIATSLFNEKKIHTLLSTGGFILLCIFAVRPLVDWLIRNTSKGYEKFTDTHVWFIMAGIVLCGLITDACGSHSIVGAFMLGVIMPNEDIVRRKIVDKLDDFVAGILMPLFFLTNGIRTDARFMIKKTHWMMVLMVIVASWAAKVVSVFTVALFYRMPPKEGLALGLLMNTKGVLALIVINTGRNIKALNNQSYPLMVLAILAMSALIEPIISFTYKPARQIVEHKNRTIQRLETNSELKVLVCLHSMRNLLGTLGLLDLSHSPNQTPISVVAVHLLELSERATTGMLIVHDEYRGIGPDNSRAKTETSQIVSAFENFGQVYDGMTIQTMTVVSPYTTMHMDICSLAEDKCVNLIILPFHRELKPDGKIGDGDPNFTEVNENVFINAPCSVGVLIDRGIGSKRFDSQNISAKFTGQIAMVFIGGPDDREALAYAWKMAAGHVQVNLTVARFLPAKDPMKSNPENKIPNEVDREKQIDDDYIEELKLKTSMNNIVWINFVDKIVNSGDETLAALKAMGDVFALYVIGRRKGEESPVTSGLSDWGCCPELGTLGDTLGSSNFALQSSILVVQQYISNNGNDDTSEDSCLVARDRE